MVTLAKYPQLRMLLWNRPDTTTLDEKEALAVYEANWRHVDQTQMTPQERNFVQQLVRQFGHGVLLV